MFKLVPGNVDNPLPSFVSNALQFSNRDLGLIGAFRERKKCGALSKRS